MAYPVARRSRTASGGLESSAAHRAVLDLAERHRTTIDLRAEAPADVHPESPASAETLDQRTERRVAAASRNAPPRRRGYEVAKRALDIAVALPLLVITSPVIAVLSLIIRAGSPGRAVFCQRRVGRDGRVICFYKFRTMYTDAKERFPELYDYSYAAEDLATAFYKPSVDPRNTPFGRKLRKTTLDELPNLFNVLRGDVSLVGPRPELPEIIDSYSDEQLLKFTVKSGITGLAQVSGRNNLTIQAQIEADLEYVRRRSFTYDLRLLVRTVVMVVKRVGAE